jgi:hypothetical protein
MKMASPALAGKIFRIRVMGPLANQPSLDLFFEAFGKCLTILATSCSLALLGQNAPLQQGTRDLSWSCLRLPAS